MTQGIPLVSILIPTYKQSGFIAEAVRSALAQDYPNLEVIVSDDASSDDTFEVAQRIQDPRLHCSRNSSNLGRVGNYRHALYDLASGDWVVNLDGDDYFADPAFISAAVQAAQEDPATVMVGAGNISVHGQRQEVRRPVDRATRMNGFDLLMNWRRYYFTHMATLYKRDQAIGVGFYDKDIISSDQESLFRLMLKGNVALLDRVVGVWRIHGDNVSRNVPFDEAIANRATYQNAAAMARSMGFDLQRVDAWERSMAGFWALDTVNTTCLSLATQTCRNPDMAWDGLERMRSLLCSGAFPYQLSGTAALKAKLFRWLKPRQYLMVYSTFRRWLR